VAGDLVTAGRQSIAIAIAVAIATATADPSVPALQPDRTASAPFGLDK
jgi:hypothetical protein